MPRVLAQLLALLTSAEEIQSQKALDVATRPGLLLAGGGAIDDAALRWFLDRAGYGDIVVLRSSGTEADDAYLRNLAPVRSVRTLVINSQEAARNGANIAAIRTSQGLFIAGGDQRAYAELWKFSPVASAIDFIATKGSPVGGTSAGLAILGQVAFTARRDTIDSKAALADPFDSRITLEDGFLTMPDLGEVITDSHFARRNRMGRLIVFMARALTDGLLEEARGVGVDEGTALTVDENGNARVAGSGAAYFLKITGRPQVCRPGAPLSLRSVAVYRVSGTARFQLRNWTGQGGTSYRISSLAGVLQSTKPGGSFY